MDTFEFSAKEIEDLLALDQKSRVRHDATFFEIIGRSYDEDLISRMLAYTLQTDQKFVNNLLEFGLRCKLRVNTETVVCEKTVPGGRIDIFVTARDETGGKYTITIENKINSWEHGDQTNIYYEFIINNYPSPQYKNIFYYLKPLYNQSGCACDRFIQITYQDLYNMIADGTDSKITDFKKHMREYFCEKELKMNDAEKKVLQHYTEMKDLMYRSESLYSAEKNKLFNMIKRELMSDQKIWNTQIDGSSYRFYKDDWWSGENVSDFQKYYFYVEILYLNDSPQEIVVQATIKRYGQRAKSSILYEIYKNGWEKAFCVHYQKRFESGYEIFSEEWTKELEDFTKTEIRTAIDKTDELFAEFIEFKLKSER